MNVRIDADKLIGGRLSAELAAVTRLLEMQNILAYSGHIAVRVPGKDALIIQRHVDSRAEVVPERMLVVDFDGKVIEGNGKPPSETPIHTEILKARPDVNVVLHCHMEIAIAFTMMKGVKLLPLRSRAVRWVSGIPIHPDPSHIKLVEQGQELARTLGPHNAVLMRAHGMTMVAESLPAMLADAVHFDENARAQLQVMQAGAEPIPLSQEDMDLINRHERREHHCNKLWNYYVRKAIAAGAIPADWGLLDTEA
jgi:ribulose-5-phosphate 4-epimerase/fuculose-1-phosphate aldolase